MPFWSEAVRRGWWTTKGLSLVGSPSHRLVVAYPPSRSPQRPYWKVTDMAKTDALLTTPTEALISVVGTGMTSIYCQHYRKELLLKLVILV